MEVIAESLRINGQYTPIIVQRSTGRILAGNHTWQAARLLQWPTIAVSFLDVSNARALEILLGDNRASDSGVTDDEAATALLATLDSLEGTGYTSADLSLSDWTELEEQTPTDEPESAPEDDAGPLPDKLEPFVIGRAKGSLLPGPYAAWRAEFPKKKNEAVGLVLFRLGMEPLPVESSPVESALDTESVKISDLVPYPGNPRQGDLGLISSLLQRHGQYRPIVVNRRNNRILKGNHVARAAQQLGWERIGVVWVDVDSPGEKRIILVDNQSANLATYDLDALGGALAELGHVDGTGFTLSDLEDVLSGQQLKPTGWRGKDVPIRIGNVKTSVPASTYRNANLTEGEELLEAAQLLGLDPKAVIQ